jgi:hypothetical protein
MKFQLNKIKLWFKNNSEPKVYEFLPNKVNVITGGATKGKTSFMSIIDYCLLSNKSRIIEKTINENVAWYSIDFNINDTNFFIARKSGNSGSVSSEVFFSDKNENVDIPVSNITIEKLKDILNKEFSIDHIENNYLANNKSISYRYFLLFNSISADIIINSTNYFDKVYYEIDSDEALKEIFLMAIGVDKMQNIKNRKELGEIYKQIDSVNRKIRKEKRTKESIELSLHSLFNECKDNNLIDADFEYNFNEVIDVISKIVNDYVVLADNEKTFSKLDNLNKEKRKINRQIYSIEKFKNEINDYNKNLKNYSDSLKPIEYIKQNFNEIIKSHEVLVFIKELEVSLIHIKDSYAKSDFKTFSYQDQLSNLKEELNKVQSEIDSLPKIKSTLSNEASKYILIGTLKSRLNQLIEEKYNLGVTDIKILEKYIKDSENLEAIIKDIESTKFIMGDELNDSIKRNYSLINSMSEYKDYKIRFSLDDMNLKLKNPNELFEIETTGSSSNYMFLHLCFYLGLHEHLIKFNNEHVPGFLFIDQPSFPYYSGEGAQVKNDDKSKLMDAFNLLNVFVKYIVEELKSDFQIFMVEHAPKEYWENNNLEYFHTVAEFTDGVGLIPNYAIKKSDN